VKIKDIIAESSNMASAEQIWDYVGGIHPKDQQGGGFLKRLIMRNPQYELKRVPLSSLHVPNDEDEGNDPYGRAMFVDVDHAREYSQHHVDKKPVVADAEGHILDGAHRAWAAAELLNRTDIMAWVPAKKLTEGQSVKQEIEEFLDSLTPDDVGVEEFPGYRIHYEGFTDDCKSSGDYKRNPNAVYKQVYQDFVDREHGQKPVKSGMAGDEDYPVLYSIFRAPQSKTVDTAERAYNIAYKKKQPWPRGSREEKLIRSDWQLSQLYDQYVVKQDVAEGTESGDFKLMGQNLFLKNLARNIQQRYPDATVKLSSDRVVAYYNEGDDERLTVMGTEVMDSGYIGVGIDDAFTESFQGVLVPTIKQTTEQLLAANPGMRPALFLSTDNWNPDAWTHIADKLGYRLVADDESLDEQDVAEGKVKLYTDPSYFGAEVDDTGFDSLPVVNISADRLVGFEPDNKMNQPKSKANVEKIVAGLKQGAKLPPLLVRKYKNGYQVLDGHHRFWAYKLLGVKSIPSRIVPDEDIEEISKQGMAEGSEQINEFSRTDDEGREFMGWREFLAIVTPAMRAWGFRPEYKNPEIMYSRPGRSQDEFYVIILQPQNDMVQYSFMTVDHDQPDMHETNFVGMSRLGAQSLLDKIDDDYSLSDLKQDMAESSDHMLSEEQPEVRPHRVTDKELVQLLGKGKTNAMLRHPWFQRYSSYEKAYRYARDRWGFVTVDMFPYMPSVNKTADGSIRPTIYVSFVFSYTGPKVVQAHQFRRDQEPDEFEKRNPVTGGWKHGSTWKVDKTDEVAEGQKK